MKILKINFDKIFESKTFEDIVKYTLLIIWIIAGSTLFFPLEGANLRSQWANGVVFGIFLTSMFYFIGDKLVKLGKFIGDRL